DLTPEQLENTWDEIRLCEKVIEQYYKRLAYICANHPEMLKTIELKSSGSMRKVADTAKAMNALAAARITDSPEILLGLCDLSIGRLEEFICTTKKIKKEEAKAWIEET